MVSTQSKIIRIVAENQDTSRPLERPSKTNWKLETLKYMLKVLQYVSPSKTSEIVWSYFTKPIKARFTGPQESILAKAEKNSVSYFGHDLVTYKWGTEGPKVLLSHGWNSKIADFRRMIEALVEKGYVVEGIDMKAHGKSPGTHTALPEIRDILKNYYVQNAPYQAVVGYSIGGLAMGVMLSELSKEIQPKNLFVIAAPSNTRYFFKEVVKEELGFRDKVYEEMCEMVETHYHQRIDYFDMRSLGSKIGSENIHLIYDEDDQTVPFDRGLEMLETFPEATFVHAKGLGHYKIIAYQDVIDHVTTNIN